MCVPISLIPVLQYPSLYAPVIGLLQHNSNSLPKTFNWFNFYKIWFRMFNTLLLNITIAELKEEDMPNFQLAWSKLQYTYH